MNDHSPVAAINAIVRAATVHDVPAIHDLLEHYAGRGALLPRPIEELYQRVGEFHVIDCGGVPVGCAALEIFTAELGEVRSLMVAPAHMHRGFGQRLVERIMADALCIGLHRLMALTYVPKFFHRLGFRTVPKDTLPEKVWGVCVKCYKFQRCDEIAVLKRLDRDGTSSPTPTDRNQLNSD